MLQSALLGLSISLLADVVPLGSGSRIDIGSGARAELNVGRVPVTSVNDSEPGTEETVVVRSGIRLISPTSTIKLVYSPQYYLRLPDALEVGRPLLLHDGQFSWAAHFNRRVSFSSALRTSAGELPNSGLLTVFDPGTGTVDTAVVPIFRLNGSISLSALTGKRHSTTAAVTGSHNDSMGEGEAIQRSDNLALQLSHSIALSQRTSGGISAQTGYVAREDQQESATIGGQLFLSQQMGPNSSLRFGAGVSQGWALGGSLSWPLPTVDVGYRTQVSPGGQSWGVNLSGGTRAFFDVTSAAYRPQVFVSAGLSGRIHQIWTIASTLSASADISGANLTTDGQPLRTQPTQFNFNVPVTYRIDDNLRLSFGLRVALSAPPLWALDSGSFQDQFSVFIALDWRTSTDKTRGSWL